MKRELPTSVYRVDPKGRVTRVATEEQAPDPNGLAFSHDYKRLYVACTGRGPGDTGPGGKGDVQVFDVGEGTLSNARRFADFMIDGVKCSPDGVRCDVLRQPLVLEQRRPGGRLQRRHDLESRRQVDRAHPPA